MGERDWQQWRRRPSFGAKRALARAGDCRASWAGPFLALNQSGERSAFHKTWTRCPRTTTTRTVSCASPPHTYMSLICASVARAVLIRRHAVRLGCVRCATDTLKESIDSDRGGNGDISVRRARRATLRAGRRCQGQLLWPSGEGAATKRRMWRHRGVADGGLASRPDHSVACATALTIYASRTTAPGVGEFVSDHSWIGVYVRTNPMHMVA